MQSRVVFLSCLASLVVFGEPEAPVSLPDVEVTAKERIQRILEEPRLLLPSMEISQSTIGQVEMQAQGARVLTDAVKYQPGIWTESRGRKVKDFVSFRGQVYPYPDYAWDGMWMPEFHEMPYLVPIAALDRVELVRSPAGLFMGMSGDVGVLNLVPRSHRDPGQVLLRLQEHETYDLSVFAPIPMAGGGMAFAAGYHETAGVSKARHGEEDLIHAMVSGQWSISEVLSLRTQVLAVRSNRELENAVEPATQALQNSLEKYEPFQAVLFGSRLDARHDERSTTSFGLAATWRQNDFVNEGPTGHIPLDEEDYSLTLDLTHAQRLSASNRLRAGLVYNQWVAPDGKRFFEGRRTEIHTAALILSDEQQVGAVLLDGGLRVARRYLSDYGAFSIEGSSKGFGSVESIEGEWEEPQVRATGGARWFMEGGCELFLHVAADETEPRTGTLDVDLETPETESRLNGELGLRHTSPAGAVSEITAFVVNRENAILLDGATHSTASGRVLELYRNQDLRQTGVELGLRQIPLADWVKAFANVTWIQSEAEQADGEFRTFPELPAWIAAAGLDATLGKVDLGLYAKHVSSYANKRFAADGKPHPLGDYVDVQLRVGTTLGSEGEHRVTLFCENLFDETYSTAVGYPDHGRRFGVEYAMTF